MDILTLIVFAIAAILVGIWAERWNRSFLLWTFLALVFSPLLMGIILAVMGKNKKKPLGQN